MLQANRFGNASAAGALAVATAVQITRRTAPFAITMARPLVQCGGMIPVVDVDKIMENGGVKVATQDGRTPQQHV